MRTFEEGVGCFFLPVPVHHVVRTDRTSFIRTMCKVLFCVNVKRHEWIPWYQVEVFALCVSMQRIG